MRAGRLVDMLLILQRRGRLTARQLATELEVSPRTVLRDVNALSGAGVPIFTVQGVHGGIELTSGFRTELTGVTAAEAAALFLAGQPMVAEWLGLGSDATAARRKLIEALPPQLRDVADHLDRWFLHDPGGRHGRDGDGDGDGDQAEAIRRLAGAIRSRFAVELTFGAPVALGTPEGGDAARLQRRLTRIAFASSLSDSGNSNSVTQSSSK